MCVRWHTRALRDAPSARRPERVAIERVQNEMVVGATFSRHYPVAPTVVARWATRLRGLIRVLRRRPPDAADRSNDLSRCAKGRPALCRNCAERDDASRGWSGRHRRCNRRTRRCVRPCKRHGSFCGYGSGGATPPSQGAREGAACVGSHLRRPRDAENGRVGMTRRKREAARSLQRRVDGPRTWGDARVGHVHSQPTNPTFAS